MSDDGSPFDPFGRSERTIIRPNPAGAGGSRRRASTASPPRRRQPAAGSPSGAGAGTNGRWTPPPQVHARRQPPERRRAVVAAPRRADHAEREPGACGPPAPLLLLLGRLRADRCCAPSPPQLHGAGRRSDPGLRARRPRRRRLGRADADREIRALRHRRRHRPEHPGRGPAGLDAVQHAEPLLRRAHRRRPLLRGARPGEGRSRASTTRCWS